MKIKFSFLIIFSAIFNIGCGDIENSDPRKMSERSSQNNDNGKNTSFRVSTTGERISPSTIVGGDDNEDDDGGTRNDKAPSCAELSPPLPFFSLDRNATNQWNNHVTSTLTSQSNLEQLKQGFKSDQCTLFLNGGGGNKFLGVSRRTCKVKPPEPIISGTNIDYGASNPDRPTIIEFRGCGGITKKPDDFVVM
jgi:hypothetical protein